MDDSNLDKLFSDGLDKEQEFDFREEDWLEVEARLEGKTRRRWGWLWMAAGIVMALSIGLNAWQGLQIKEVKKEISALQETMEEQSTLANETNNISDFDKNTEATELSNMESSAVAAIQHDTIYQTIIKEREIPVYIERIVYRNKAVEKNETSEPQAADPLFALEQMNAPATTISTTSPTIDLLDPVELALLDGNAYHLEKDSMDWSSMLPQNTIPTARQAFKKKYFLGPALAYSRIPIPDFVDQLNGSAGIDFDLQLSEKWTLEADYSINRINSTSLTTVDSTNYFIADNTQYDEFADDLSYNVADPNGLGTGATSVYINNVATRQNYQQISLGGKYNLGKQIYLGAQVLAYHSLDRFDTFNAPSSTKNRLTNALESADLTSSSDGPTFSRNKSSVVLDRLQVTAGKEFNIKNKWRMPVEFFYQQNLNQTDYSLPPLLGIRASFLRKL